MERKIVLLLRAAKSPEDQYDVVSLCLFIDQLGSLAKTLTRI